MTAERQHGFVLLEAALAAACLLCICAAAVPAATGLQEYHYKAQVRLAADILAADIRQLQQETMFSSAKVGKTLYVSSDKQSYSIYRSSRNSPLCKKTTFMELGCTDVYFSQQLQSISFYFNGSSKSSGSIVLKHKQLKGFYCNLSLQPVTGRVTVTEYDG